MNVPNLEQISRRRAILVLFFYCIIFLTVTASANASSPAAPRNGTLPDVVDDYIETLEEQPILIDILASDVANAGSMNSESVNITVPPKDGTATVQNGGRIRYAPKTDFNGADWFMYGACNTANGCGTAKVSILVMPLNDNPVVAPIATQTILASGSGSVIAAITDNDDTEFTVTATSNNPELFPPGSIIVGGNDADANRPISLTPATGKRGQATVTVTATDDEGGAGSASFTVTVVAPDLNLNISDGGVSVLPGETINYTAQYSNNGNNDATGVVLTMTVPANTAFNLGASSTGWSCADDAPAATVCTNAVSSLAVGGSGSKTFAVTVNPAAPLAVTEVNVTGSITDDGTNGAAQTPDVNEDNEATPLKRKPTVNPDSDTIAEDTAANIPVLNNDVANSGTMDENSVSVTRPGLTPPSSGTVTVRPNGEVRYTPNQNFNGSDSFEYEACNTDGECGTAEVTVTVTPVNDAPTIDPIASVTMIEGAERIVIVTVNDVDNNNGTLVVTATSNQPTLLPNNRITVLPGDTPSQRKIRLQPLDNQTGIATVTVVVSDSDKNSSTQFSVTVTAPDLTIRSISDGGASVRPGNTVIYSIQYSNQGNGDATGVRLEVDVPANTTFGAAGSSSGWSCSNGAAAGTTCVFPVGELDKGESGSKSFAVMLDRDVPPSVTEVSVSAAIRDDGANGDDIDPGNNTGSDMTPIDRSVLLRATKRDTPLPSDDDNITDAGDTVVYTVVVRNSGVTDAEGMTFSDTPDPNSTIVPGSVVTDKGTILSGNDAGDQSVEIEIGTLAADEAATIVFHVQINDPLPENIVDVSNQGTFAGLNFPSVKTDDPDTASVSDATVTPLGPRPVLTALKSDQLANDTNGNGVPSPGETLRYEVSITNRGQVQATNVLLEDTPDPATTLIAGTVGATDPSAIISKGNGSGDTDVEVRIPTLDAAETVTITFNVQINSPLSSDAVQIANQGRVRSAELPTIVTDDPDTLQADDPTRTTVAIIPVLRVDKQALVTDVDGDGDSGPGDLIDYTITVRNEGTAADNVLLTDPIATVLTLTPSVPDGDLVQVSRGEIRSGLNPGDDTVEVAIGELGGGESAIITFRVKIADTLPADLLVVENQAVATADGVDPVPSDNPNTLAPNDSTQTPVTAVVILRAPMRDLLPVGGEISIGDTLTYNPSIENVGNRAAANVRITGTLSPQTELDPASVRAGTGGIVERATDREFSVLFPTLPAGQTRAVILDVIILGTVNGKVENQFVVTADNMLGSVVTDDQDTDEVDDENITVIDPDGVIDALLLPIIRVQ